MSNTRYKVGDKVRVREDLSWDEVYGGVIVTGTMRYYRGKVVEITSKNNVSYSIKGCPYYFSDEMFEPVFTKADLKTGHVVTVRSGEKLVLIKNMDFSFDDINVPDTNGSYFISITGYGYNLLDEYDDDLCVKDSNVDSFDIMKVEEATTPYALGKTMSNRKDWYKTIWERPVPKKMTKAEIEEALGYKIELV